MVLSVMERAGRTAHIENRAASRESVVVLTATTAPEMPALAWDGPPSEVGRAYS